jgi:hypothetical protein
MEPVVDREDVTAIVRGVFGIRSFLSDISRDLAATRAHLEDDDHEEDQDG